MVRAKKTDKGKAFRASLIEDDQIQSIEREQYKRRGRRTSNFQSNVSPLDPPPKPDAVVPVLLEASLERLHPHVLLDTDPLRAQRQPYTLSVNLLSTRDTVFVLLGFMLSSVLVIMPRVLALVGLVQLGVFLAIGYACTKTTALLVQSIEHCKETIDSTVCTWDDVVMVALNRTGKISWCVLSVAQLFASAVTFIVICVDHIVYTYPATTNHDLNIESTHIHNKVIITAIVYVALCITSLMPLDIRSRFHSLGVLLTVIVSIFVFLVPFLSHWFSTHEENLKDDRVCGYKRALRPEYIPFGLVATMFCLGAHTPVAQTINRAMETPEDFPVVHNTASIISLIIFLFTAGCGVYFYGHCTHEEITLNLVESGLFVWHHHVNVGRIFCGIVAASALATATTQTRPVMSFFCSLFISRGPPTTLRVIARSCVQALVLALHCVVAWLLRGEILIAATIAGALTTCVSVAFPNMVFAVLRWEALETAQRVTVVSVAVLSFLAAVAGVVVCVVGVSSY